MKEKCLLIGDIGGTNARFALANTDAPGFRDVLELKCANFESSTDAIQHYLREIGAGTPDAMCLAAAGPVVDEAVDLTNNHWQVSVAEVRKTFGVAAVSLLNDFEAIAYSIPFLEEDDSVAIACDEEHHLPDKKFDVAIMGPGTGLGIAGLCRRGETLVPVTGEGGHVGFAPETPLQAEILSVLQQKFDRVSTERLVAGSGLPNIYEALAVIRGEPKASPSAAEIFAAAKEGGLAAEVVDVFFEMLGQVAGDLALLLGALDGVYIAGGIAKRYPDILEHSRFRSAFEDKGRYEPVMKRIPTRLILHEQPGLLGAAYCALESSA